MIRRYLFALRLLLLGIDAATAAVTFLAIGQVRFGDAAWNTFWEAFGLHPTTGAVFYAVCWTTILWFLGMYEFRTRWSIGSELDAILVGSVLMAFGTMTFLYIIKLDVSRLFLLSLFVILPLLTVAGRMAMRYAFEQARRRGRNRAYMIVIGTCDDAQAFADAIEGHAELGLQVVGHLRAPDDVQPTVTRPILGTADEVARIFHERVVDEVAICSASETSEWAEPLIALAADEGKHVRIPTRIQPRTFDISSEELDGMMVRSYVHGPARILSLAVKRVLDIAGALAGLVVLSPVFGLTALAILLREGRPILYHQTRIGLHGRTFQMYKFRSMVRDADARFAEVQHLNERMGIAFKSAADPRITPIGRFIRATSIDELPQLWNVLRGEMSLVGPRPPLEREVVAYDIWHRRRLSMKPGITGLWQVEARQEGDFDNWVQRDLSYIDRWSLGLDMKILVKTVPAVVARTGK